MTFTGFYIPLFIDMCFQIISNICRSDTAYNIECFKLSEKVAVHVDQQTTITEAVVHGFCKQSEARLEVQETISYDNVKNRCC